MIQVNELRIGATFINSSDGLFEDGKYVTLDRHHFYWAFESSQNLEDLLEPIPLTPEILEKCGFEKWEDANVYQLNCADEENIQIRGNEVFLAGNDACTDGHGFHCKCEYLHKLQNLYSALTGEELVIKELQHA